MAQRSSRSNKKKSRSKGEVRKQPELRTGGGRTVKAERARARQAAATTGTSRGQAVRVRPPGGLAFAYVLLLSWIGVALVALLGHVLHRWDILSYPDSLWLYALIGTVAVAPALGRVARGTGDADSWGAQALLVPLGMLVAEQVFGPGCPAGGNCDVVGARGSFGLIGSIAIIVVLAAVAWQLARWSYGRSRDRRPAHGRITYGITTGAVVSSILLLGIPLTAVFTGLDLWVRKTPKLVADAKSDVVNFCFSFDANPKLSVRPSPDGIDPLWSTFAVRRSSESRPGVGGSKLPSNWSTLDTVNPYEAIVSYSDGGISSISCRRVSPDSGNAVKADLVPNAPESNPLDPATTGSQFRPLFYSQDTSAIANKAAVAAAKKKIAAAQAKPAATSKSTKGAPAATKSTTKK